MSHGQHRGPRRNRRERREALSQAPPSVGPGEGDWREETEGPAGAWEEDSKRHAPAGPRHWPVEPSPRQIATAREHLAEYAERFPIPLPTEHPNPAIAKLCQLLTVMHDAAATLDAALRVRELDELQDHDLEEFAGVPNAYA